MNPLQKTLILLVSPASMMAGDADPWTQPRDLSQFQFLLDRSPFCLPTVEESSPIADRYTLTGAVSLDGEPMVFVLDKTTQERHMISKTPNKLDMKLVEYLPDPDPRHMRATVNIGGQVATLTFAEPVAQPPGAPQNTGMAPPPTQHPTAVVNPPMQSSNPQVPRRVIRRRIISSQPPGP